MSVSELSSLLDVSQQYLYDQAKRGTIPAAKLPGLIRFDPLAIASWWEERSL
jgi:excisionase family DNA binding protein